MYSLIYVSRSLLAPGQVAPQMDAIITVSVARNRSTAVTGALLFAGNLFAQLLEGAEDAVLALMSSIARDTRHYAVTTLEQGATDRRRFGRWSMADLGHSTFASATVERALAGHGTGDDHALRNLIRMLEELARQAG